VCHVFSNAWGYTAPGWGLGWGLHVTGGAWIASHLWEHYLFTGDTVFLEQRAYPILKDAAEFFLAYMVEDPKHHYLVTGPSPSPENSYVAPDGKQCSESMGPTCDAVLVRDLFSSCIEASRILGKDAEFAARLEAARAKLPPLLVGKNGQLREWLEDFDEAIPNHRHTSHLISLYPSGQITVNGTPELAQAARVTIERRTTRPDWEDVEWSRGNMINFHARLADGDKAYESVLGLLRKLTDKNLLTFSVGGIAGAPENIFVVDGNSAGTAGIAEMLLQSHGGEIRLLPALPKAWPSGEVTGLRARGGYDVDIAWRDGRMTAGTIRATRDGVCRIRSAEPVSITVNGATAAGEHPENNVTAVGVKNGDTIRVTPGQ
jgi:alpha-L-fucosidase 2